MLRWALLLAVLLIVVIFALIVGQIMRRVVLNAVGGRQVIFAGHNSSSLALARTLESNPALRLQVEGFSTTGAPIGCT